METAFNKTLALSLGRLCQLTYEQYSSYKASTNWVLDDEYNLLSELYVPYEGDHVPIGFLCEKDGYAYIAWRGTDNLKEWIQDIKFEQVVTNFLPEAKVEKGFHELYTTGHTSIVSPQSHCFNILDQLSSYKGIYITGHSLGAALAVLNAVDIATKLDISPVVYTYAGPRVGDEVFASHCTKHVPHCWRIVNSNDEVPKVPPEKCPPILHHYDYSHVNHEYEICFGNRWDLLEDHNLDHYIATVHSHSPTV